MVLSSELEYGDTDAGADLVIIGRPKTRATGGRIQHVMIYCPWVRFWLSSLKGLLDPSPETRIFPNQPYTFGKRMKQLTDGCVGAA